MTARGLLDRPFLFPTTPQTTRPSIITKFQCPEDRDDESNPDSQDVAKPDAKANDSVLNGQRTGISMLRDRQDDSRTSEDGFTQLHFAADFGKLDMVQQILAREGTINLEAKDQRWGNTPLFRAVFSGHNAIVGLLLDSKANPDTANKANISAVYQAATTGRDSLKLLADAKANLEAKSSSGQTPLHGACLNDQNDSIRMLLDLKADPNTTTKCGVQALYLASERGNISAIELLIARRAQINAPSSDGITSLMRAAYKGKSEAVKALVNLGADVWIQGKGQTASSWATKQGHNEIAKYLELEMAKQKQTNQGRSQQPGFDLFAVDSEGFTRLHRAAQAGNVQLIAQLISLKANLEAKDTCQNTSLFRAVLADKPDAVAELLKAGAKVDALNKDGVSPLYQACAIGNVDTIELLIQSKADLEHKSTLGQSPLHQTPLHAACLNGKTAAVQLLVDNNVDLEAVTRSNEGALYMAAERGHVDVIKVLVDAGANVNSLGPDGITPLMRAAYKGKGLAAKALLELNANPSRVAMEKTAAQWAEQQGNHDVITILNEAALSESNKPTSSDDKRTKSGRRSTQINSDGDLKTVAIKCCDLINVTHKRHSRVIQGRSEKPGPWMEIMMSYFLDWQIFSKYCHILWQIALKNHAIIMDYARGES